MPELPIFHTKNLEIGKTYKGLINNEEFTVIGFTKGLYEQVFLAIDKNKYQFTISPNLRLYIKEVTK